MSQHGTGHQDVRPQDAYDMYLRLIGRGYAGEHQETARLLAKQHGFDTDKLDSAVAQGQAARDKDTADMDVVFKEWRLEAHQIRDRRRKPATASAP